MTREEQIKKMKNEYHKKWRAKNKDKVKEYNERYWDKKLNQMEQEQYERS